jgi:hypothetical protein
VNERRLFIMTMHLVHELPPVSDRDGNEYSACVIGAPAKDGLWNGAIELHDRLGRRLATPVETRQASLADLVYWSTGLSKVYVEGALARAQAAAAAAAVAAEAPGEPAALPVERGLRFRRPVRPTPSTRRAASSASSAPRSGIRAPRAPSTRARSR